MSRAARRRLRRRDVFVADARRRSASSSSRSSRSSRACRCTCLVDQLDDPIVRDALVLTATTNAIALAVILLVGTPAAYFLGTRRFRGRTLVITLVELPLVLPPTVAGIGLLAAFAGRIGLLAGIFDRIGVSVVFTTTAVVIAICFVAGPFYLRQAIAAFETLDKDVLDAARVDGAGPLRVLLSVSIPLAEVGPRRRRRARVRARRRRVRRDDHVRRQPPRRHADAAAPDLPGLRAQLRRLARDQRAARGRQRSAPDHGEADRPRARQGARRRARARQPRPPPGPPPESLRDCAARYRLPGIRPPIFICFS